MTDRDEVRRIDFPGLDDGLQVLRRLGQGLMPHAYA